MTLPDVDILAGWIDEHKANGHVAHITATRNRITGEVTHEIVASVAGKEYDPAWPVFVGYPFTRSVPVFDPAGKRVAWRSELITNDYYRTSVVEEGKRKKSGAMPVPFGLIVLLEDHETQCLVCVREDVYERKS